MACRSMQSQFRKGAVSALAPARKQQGARVSPSANKRVTTRAIFDNLKKGVEQAKKSVGLDSEFGEVEKIWEMRPGTQPGVQAEYLVSWTDDHPDSWEPEQNLAEDVLREWEGKWWDAVKKGEVEAIVECLDKEGRDPNRRDPEGRTGLHYTCGLGQDAAAEALLERGASTAVGDKDGYTALHIASGYVHTNIVELLLEYGSNPEQKDATGRDALDLASTLLKNTPKEPVHFSRRMGLSKVVNALETNVFEDAEVLQILDKKTDGFREEFLVQWVDDFEDTWLPKEEIHPEVIANYEQGMEFADVDEILDKREREGVVEYYIKWSDGGDNTWEPVENISEDAIADYEKALAAQV